MLGCPRGLDASVPKLLMPRSLRQSGLHCGERVKLAKIGNMKRQVSATDAKNNFGGLLEDVAAFGRVDIIKHGRLVAVVLAPRMLDASPEQPDGRASANAWGATHMIPAAQARAARMTKAPRGFDDT